MVASELVNIWYVPKYARPTDGGWWGLYGCMDGTPSDSRLHYLRSKITLIWGSLGALLDAPTVCPGRVE